MRHDRSPRSNRNTTCCSAEPPNTPSPDLDKLAQAAAVTFGAMFLASPVQWATGRSQVRVRKYLGIVFFLLALTNGAMFVVESGLTDTLSAPFLIAGTLAVAFATPLFLTSSRRSQQMLGMKRWRLLHKLTYVVGAALLGHLLLIPEIGPGALLITVGLVSRVPAVQRNLRLWGTTQSTRPSK